jgi:hypothetical protein
LFLYGHKTDFSLEAEMEAAHEGVLLPLQVLHQAGKPEDGLSLFFQKKATYIVPSIIWHMEICFLRRENHT